MVLKWNDGSRVARFRIIWLGLAAQALYGLLRRPNAPAFLVLVEVVEVLLAAVFLAAQAQMMFCPEHIARPRRGGEADGGDAAVLPLEDGQVPRAIDDGGGGELPKAQPAQCKAAVIAPRSYEHGEDGGSSVAECAVCLGEVEKREMVRRLPACQHVFHQECIDLWLRDDSTCPVCRCGVFAPSADEMV